MVVVEDVHMGGSGFRRAMKVVAEYGLWRGERVNCQLILLGRSNEQEMLSVRPCMTVRLPDPSPDNYFSVLNGAKISPDILQLTKTLFDCLNCPLVVQIRILKDMNIKISYMQYIRYWHNLLFR